MLGGSVLAPVQGALRDRETVNVGLITLPAVHASFVLPSICFAVITQYECRTRKYHPG